MKPARDLGILLICLMLTGCGYTKSTFIKVSADKAEVPLKGIGTISGEGIYATINRAVNVVSPIKKVTLDSKIEDKVDKIVIEK